MDNRRGTKLVISQLLHLKPKQCNSCNLENAICYSYQPISSLVLLYPKTAFSVLRPWHLFIETLESMSSLFFFLIGLKECFHPPWVKQQIRRSRFTENISTNIISFKQNCMMKVKQHALVVNVTVISVRISTALHLVCFIYVERRCPFKTIVCLLNCNIF